MGGGPCGCGLLEQTWGGWRTACRHVPLPTPITSSPPCMLATAGVRPWQSNSPPALALPLTGSLIVSAADATQRHAAILLAAYLVAWLGRSFIAAFSGTSQIVPCQAPNNVL